MGSRIFYMIKTQFGFVNKRLLYDFLSDSMYRIVSFLCSCVFYLLASFFKQFFRFLEGKAIANHESYSDEVYHQEDDNQIGTSCLLASDIDQSETERQNSVVEETSLLARRHKYEFLSGKGISGFMEEPRTMSFIVHEPFHGSNDDKVISNSVFDTGGSSTEEDFFDIGLDAEKAEEEEVEKTETFVKSRMIDEGVIQEQDRQIFKEELSSKEEELVSEDGVTADTGNHEMDAEETDNSAQPLVSREFLEMPEQETETVTEEKSYDNEDIGHLKYNFEVYPDLSDEVHVEEESTSSKDELSSMNDETNSASYELPATGTAREVHESETPVCLEDKKEECEREPESVPLEPRPESCALADEATGKDTREPELIFTRDQSTDSDDEYIELQPQKRKSSNVVDKQEQGQESVQEEAEPQPDSLERSGEHGFRDQKFSKFHFQSEKDNMFEHEELIEQLKMELKLARTGGLPTILEESECEESETPKQVQGLKPMKIDEKKFEHKDLLDGIQKVYKSYVDKMRKLDILNFQTMHALGLLQMKGTVRSQAARKSSVIALTSLLSQNLWLCKGTAVVDPLKKVIADMNRDFETIYVGQLCLSWEILHWQYCTVQELQKYGSQVSHQYNQVAGEFQLFQVLIQRFLENEQFLGLRVQNYVKNRCVLRSLLQVPLVKDDCFRDKGTRGDDHENAITSQMLAGIIEQSMRTFWEFLRADKDDSNVIFQGNLQTHHNLQDLVDLELLTDVRTDFQKKEKKLKDILRSGNCIVKKFKKQQEDGTHRTLLIAQVELKLISRVLNTSKLTTDQLIWCHEKLDKINFHNRKVFVESSFLIFPC